MYIFSFLDIIFKEDFTITYRVSFFNSHIAFGYYLCIKSLSSEVILMVSVFDAVDDRSAEAVKIL